MNYISRELENIIKKRLFKGKIIVVYGARQVGKTTLVKKILKDFKGRGSYLNCDLLSVQNALSEMEAEKLKAYLGNFDLIVLDEAQNIPNVGKILKILIDAFPKMQFIATGSSSFDLAQKVSEPLTGRTFTLSLYPVSLREIGEKSNLMDIESRMENFLRFGNYPEILSLDENSSREQLNEIASKYLYKDVLKFEGLRKSSLIQNLLRLLALQIGQEVSYNELAVQLGVNRLTVQKYIDVMEQSFVLFKLNALSRNMRKEISKSVKVYFYDLGIRNTLIENFNRLDMRSDTGALWENFCIMERKKNNGADLRFVNSYFWRTYDQKEIDYIEESEGKITGFEFRWGEKKHYRPPQNFIEEYKAEVEKVDKKNFWKFLDLAGQK